MAKSQFFIPLSNLAVVRPYCVLPLKSEKNLAWVRYLGKRDLPCATSILLMPRGSQAASFFPDANV